MTNQQRHIGVSAKKEMTTRRYKKLVREGRYVAEVEVELIEAETGLAPYLSLDDAYNRDDIRDALSRDDIKAASRLARVFILTPVAA